MNWNAIPCSSASALRIIAPSAQSKFSPVSAMELKLKEISLLLFPFLLFDRVADGEDDCGLRIRIEYEPAFSASYERTILISDQTKGNCNGRKTA